MISVVAGVFVGLLVGLRHVFEPDHLAAVSTMVAQRRTRAAAARLGAWWGIGHTIALLVFSGALIVAGRSVPPGYERALELAVGVMLIAMGARALWRATHGVGPVAEHAHGSHVHEHAGPADHVHVGDRVLAWRPLAVGLIHGTAGSGALTAVVMAELPTNAARVGYVLLFGLGSIAGMALLSGLAGGAAARFARSTGLTRGLTAATGLLALVVGAGWALRALAGA
jgi:hypothetical protein